VFDTIVLGDLLATRCRRRARARTSDAAVVQVEVFVLTGPLRTPAAYEDTVFVAGVRP